MLIVLAAVLIAGSLGLILFVRPKDLPTPLPASPFDHLDERKAAIYESLRDLQFEFRLGKVSEADYQKSKTELQSELARVMAEIDKLKAQLGASTKETVVRPATAKTGSVCPHCNARFDRSLKFCGECGKAMGEGAA